MKGDRRITEENIFPPFPSFYSSSKCGEKKGRREFLIVFRPFPLTFSPFLP